MRKGSQLPVLTESCASAIGKYHLFPKSLYHLTVLLSWLSRVQGLGTIVILVLLSGIRSGLALCLSDSAHFIICHAQVFMA